MWQSATKCHMAKSIRISDEIYELALQEAGLMHRSLAQQVEYWVKLGVGVEHARGATLDDVRSAAARYRLAKDADEVKQGKRKAESLWVIPRSLAKSPKVKFPRDAFASARKGAVAGAPITEPQSRPATKARKKT
jgi:hypothetical protein